MAAKFDCCYVMLTSSDFARMPCATDPIMAATEENSHMNCEARTVLYWSAACKNHHPARSEATPGLQR